MATKIFLTGATGYIGGSVLDTIVTHHPEYDITVLLRSVPPTFSQRYPNIHIVKGDYDSEEILRTAASNANIVVHNGNSDHEPSIRALIAGLLSRPSSSPSFLIHLGGTGVVADWHSPDYRGSLRPKVWSDVADIAAIRSRPDGELHRNVDKIILDAAAAAATATAQGSGGGLKTAIMCPPDIYGPGKGLGKTASVLLPSLVDESKPVGATFYCGDGTNTRSWVHIDDVTSLYLKVVEAAAEGGGSADWGLDGYYFAASSEASQIDMATFTGKILHAHGVLPTATPKQISEEQVGKMLSHYGRPGIGWYMYAANSRTRADRARAVFGWEPKAPGFWESIEADLLAHLKN